MFGGGSVSPSSKADASSISDAKSTSSSTDSSVDPGAQNLVKISERVASGEKRSGNGSPSGRSDGSSGSIDKKRRSSGVGNKASSLLASAKNSLNFSQVSRAASELTAQTPLQKLGKQDPALAVPQGQHNNSAGDSTPGPRSTFHVGVWEDRNKKCRRTMEDTHAFLYNFLNTPTPSTDQASSVYAKSADQETIKQEGHSAVESDNGYFAIFDGHAGTFAADWCGKKLHIILEDAIRRHPESPLPELLDQTFTAADAQLEKLPLKNSGCTAAVAVLRWEDRVPNERSATGSQAMASAAATLAKSTGSEEATQQDTPGDKGTPAVSASELASVKLKSLASRQRVLYTANVGDARIILCRSGKALRLSYDHKGSDENEGRRIGNAGGLILNNRVNGVLAVTRALGDTYMKELVVGRPYTTETIIQPDMDEFMLIACDGVWDVCSDQEAVDLVRGIQDPVAASKLLVDHALNRFSTDNLSCMVIRFDQEALSLTQSHKNVGLKPDFSASAGVSEADKIVMDTKQRIADGSTPAVGVSASNSGRGHEPTPLDDGGFVPTTLDGSVPEEEPGASDESKESNIDSPSSADATPILMDEDRGTKGTATR